MILHTLINSLYSRKKNNSTGKKPHFQICSIIILSLSTLVMFKFVFSSFYIDKLLSYIFTFLFFCSAFILFFAPPHVSITFIKSTHVYRKRKQYDDKENAEPKILSQNIKYIAFMCMLKLSSGIFFPFWLLGWISPEKKVD